MGKAWDKGEQNAVPLQTEFLVLTHVLVTEQDYDWNYNILDKALNYNSFMRGFTSVTVHVTFPVHNTWPISIRRSTF